MASLLLHIKIMGQECANRLFFMVYVKLHAVLCKKVLSFHILPRLNEKHQYVCFFFVLYLFTK